MSESKILTVNPGSTSTKVAYFENTSLISAKTLRHSPEELKGYHSLMEQYDFRKRAVNGYLSEEGIREKGLDAVAGRGGLLRPLQGGTYNINTPMLEDLKNSRFGEHASNLGAVIAYEIANETNIPSFIVNPVVVDEFEPPARYSGLSSISRKSTFHALNHKAVAAKAALQLGRKYDQVNLVVAHLGGGITVGAHCKGKVIDVSHGLEEGAFSPERSGGLPILQLLDICFLGKYSKAEIKKMLVGNGGLIDYLGTSDCKVIEERINNGDDKARNVLYAMAYQVSKEIAAYSAVLFGCVDAVVITGGLAYSDMLVQWILERVKFIAPVKVYPGEDEMQALAEGAYKVLIGEEQALNY